MDEHDGFVDRTLRLATRVVDAPGLRRGSLEVANGHGDRLCTTRPQSADNNRGESRNDSFGHLDILPVFRRQLAH